MHADRAMVIGRRLTRFLLLVCTLVGLAAMHSIGHEGVHVAAMTADGHGRTAMDSTTASVASVTCSADDCAHMRMVPAGVGAGMGGWTICLAVLGAFAAAMLFAALLLAKAAERNPGDLLGRRMPTGPRAPPDPPVGLLLATMSVLRT